MAASDTQQRVLQLLEACAQVRIQVLALVYLKDGALVLGGSAVEIGPGCLQLRCQVRPRVGIGGSQVAEGQRLAVEPIGLQSRGELEPGERVATERRPRAVGCGRAPPERRSPPGRAVPLPRQIPARPVARMQAVSDYI